MTQRANSALSIAQDRNTPSRPLQILPFASLGTVGLAAWILCGLFQLVWADPPAASPVESASARPPTSQPVEGRPPYRGSRGEGDGSSASRRPPERIREMHADGFAGGLTGLSPAFRPNVTFSPEQEKEVLTWAGKNFPEQYKNYESLSRTNPEMAQRQKQQMLRHCFAIMQLSHDEPALADTVIADIRLQEDIARTVSNWQNTSDAAQRTDLEATLTDQLIRQAKVRLENRRLRLESLVKRMDAERNRLEVDQSRIPELVQTRRAELLKPRPATSQPAPR